MKNMARRFMQAGLTAFTCLFAFCTIMDDNGNPIDPGTGIPGDGPSSTVPLITAAPDSNYVRVGDTIAVRVQLLSDTVENAAPLNRARVEVATSLGWISSRTITTDGNGRATVFFSHQLEETAVLTFKYGGVQQSVLIEVSNTAPRNITINASPSVLMADGSSRSIITVQVKNDFNNPIVGDTIRFATSAGMITASGVTDSDGKATAQLTSEKRNAIATITATLKSDPTRSTKMNVEFSGIQVSATATPASIRTDGRDTCIVLATVLDASGNPISGERVIFSKQLDSTLIVGADSVTNARGEARARIVKRPNRPGVTVNIDTITAAAAGASAFTALTFSNQILNIERMVNGQVAANTHIPVAHKDSTTTFRITYRDGNNQNLGNAKLEISVTMGLMEGTNIFADTLRTASNGRATFTINNPSFTNVATIFVKAYDPTPNSNEFITAFDTVYFQASAVRKITLSGTPSVINVNNGTARITATAEDEFGNRVRGAVISFNMLRGPGGGEHLEPATAVTGMDGTASTSLKAGTLPSHFKDVHITASDFAGLRSDTVKFTIAGPPHSITVNRNMKEVASYPATYGLAISALVSDINGNPVADETEVTFSASVVSYLDFSEHSIQCSWNEPFPCVTIKPVPSCEGNECIIFYGRIRKAELPQHFTTLLITRTVLTKDGIADNELIYGQSAAWKHEASILVEAQGKRSNPLEFILPIEEGAAERWSPW